MRGVKGVVSDTLPTNNSFVKATSSLGVLLDYAAAPNPRVSEALALDSDQPTIGVRQGKGGRSRIVPVHPELLNALDAVLQFSQMGRVRS